VNIFISHVEWVCLSCSTALGKHNAIGDFGIVAQAGEKDLALAFSEHLLRATVVCPIP
jgi:hypothetical protein